jgi:hypothetical protein
MTVDEAIQDRDQHVNHHRRERAIAERIAKTLFEANLLTLQDSGSLTIIKDAEHIATRILVEATDTRDRHGERQIALWIADTLFRHGLMTMGGLSCMADIITAVLVADSQERAKRPATPMEDYSGAERVPQIPLIPDQLHEIRMLMRGLPTAAADLTAMRCRLETISQSVIVATGNAATEAPLVRRLLALIQDDLQAIRNELKSVMSFLWSHEALNNPKKEQHKT